MAHFSQGDLTHWFFDFDRPLRQIANGKKQSCSARRAESNRHVFKKSDFPIKIGHLGIARVRREVLLKRRLIRLRTDVFTEIRI